MTTKTQNVARQKYGWRRVLVTGGAGFLGSHLIDRLLAGGDEVLCVDNLFVGDKSNIDHLAGHPRFEFMRHDTYFPHYVEVDEIFNLACPASPINCQRDPVQTTKTSVIGAINILGLAKRLRVPILLASTSEVYGDPQIDQQTDGYWGNAKPIGLISCCDEGKPYAETLFFDYQRQHDIDVKVVRILNTYGPRMHAADGRVVSNFIVQALNGEDITIFGDGSQTRSICYVDDLIQEFIGFMEAGPDLHGPINLGNPNEFTILELAEKVIALTGSRSKLIRMPLPSDDPNQHQPDITIAKRGHGNWSPTIGLEEGLQRTTAYFRDRIEVAA